MKNNLPQRKNIRLKQYNYSNEGYYFITICTKNKECILSTIGSVKTDPYIKLTNIGNLVKENLIKIEQHFKTVKIDDYVIMPNHLHFIIQKSNIGIGLERMENKINISNIIGLFKSGVSRKIGYSI